jgi:tetratricopeptide (TPR) repeat protein
MPTGLDAVIRRCLAKDPHERYAQAGEVRAALESVRTEVASGLAHPPPRRSKPRWSANPRVATAVVLALVVLVAGSVAVVRRSGTPDAAPVTAPSGPPTIAVMNFDNSTGNEDTAWLSKGIPSMLLTSLAQTRGLRLVSAQHLRETVGQLGLTLEGIDAGQVADVARRAGAGAVVVGSVVRSGSELRIDAQVADLASGRVLLAESVRGSDLFPLVDQLAARIRDSIGVGNAAEIRSVADVSSTSVEAYRLYSEGEQAWISFRLEDAEKALTHAVTIDPAFAEAYLQLASVMDFLNRPIARASYLRQASIHADRLNERQRLLAEVEWAREEGDFAKAARALDTVLDRFPDFEEAYVSATLYEPVRGAIFDPQKQITLLNRGIQSLPTSGGIRNLMAYALLSVGRHADAVRELDAYARLAPREPNPYDSLGEAYLMLGLPEKAIEYYTRALTIDPTFSGSHTGRAWARAMLGQYDAAIAENPSLLAVRAFLLSRVGRYKEAAGAIAAGVRQATADSNQIDQGEMELLTAVLAIERGDAERALRATRAAAARFAVPADERNRVNLVMVDLLGGMAELRAGRIAPARERLEAIRRRYRSEWPPEQFWFNAFRGDIALADGRFDEAAAAYAEGEPKERMWASMARSRVASILANNLPSRDGLARVRKARGDFGGAIQEYRRLTTPGTGQLWMAMLEPRYVLELARLLDRTGDKPAALVEYRRALDLFKGADADVPELTEVRRALAR